MARAEGTRRKGPTMVDGRAYRGPVEVQSQGDGERDHRAFIGCAGRYDAIAATQFNLLTLGGLREEHTVCDIGCGSLRLGRLLIPYLEPERYFGIEPEEWLVEEGIEREIGAELVARKKPAFQYGSDFDLPAFGVEFDRLIAHSVLSHAGPDQVTSCFGAARSTMGKRSVFYATFLLGRRDHEGGWAYPELVPYTPGWIRRTAGANGLHAALLDWPHPHKQRWVQLTRADASAGVRRSADPSRVVARGARRMRAIRTPVIGPILAARRALVRRRAGVEKGWR